MDRKRFVIDQIVICQAIIGVCWMELKLNQKSFSSWEQPPSVKLIPSNSHPEVNGKVFERTRKHIFCVVLMSCLRCVWFYDIRLDWWCQHLSDLGKGNPFFCHWISGVGEPLNLKISDGVIQMGDYLILPPTRSSSSWSLSPWRPAAALQADWGAWLQGLGNELVHQVGRRVWIIWLLYFQEEECTIYKLYNIKVVLCYIFFSQCSLPNYLYLSSPLIGEFLHWSNCAGRWSDALLNSQSLSNIPNSSHLTHNTPRGFEVSHSLSPFFHIKSNFFYKPLSFSS